MCVCVCMMCVCVCGVSQQFRQLVINVWCHIGSIDGRSIKHKLSVGRNFLSSGSPTKYTIILPPENYQLV